MKKLLLVPVLALMSASCADYQPIVDQQGIDSAQYQADLQDCRGYSEQVQDNSLRNAAIGAAVGAALGSVTGGNRSTVGTGAGIGAIGGGGTSMAKKSGEKEKVLKNCLRGRGYQILN